jgi:hypothetical protein
MRDGDFLTARCQQRICRYCAKPTQTGEKGQCFRWREPDLTPKTTCVACSRAAAGAIYRNSRESSQGDESPGSVVEAGLDERLGVFDVTKS